MLFSRLGHKIIRDAYRDPPTKPAVDIDDEQDDQFYRYSESDDVMYHGGCDSEKGMTDDQRYDKAMGQLKCVTVVGLFFVTLQAIGAYWANSIAIATDCAHLATDIFAFLISIAALALTRKGSSEQYTFGWHRSEIIGSIMSIVFLLTITIYLVVEAIKRIFEKYEIEGTIMMITAILSLIFNLILINILHQDGHDHGDGGHDHGHSHGHSHGDKKKDDGHGHGHSHGEKKKDDGHGHGHGHGHGEKKKDDGHSHGHAKKEEAHGHSHGKSAAEESKNKVAQEKAQNINVTAAYLHILGDLLLSVGVVLSSIVIWYWPTDKYPWSKYFDPACTLIFSIIICYTCKDVLRQSIFILMEGAPDAVEVGKMLLEMKKL